MCPCSPPMDVYCSRIYCRFDFCLAAYICTQAKERLNVNESKSLHLGSFCLDSVMAQDGFWATSSTDAHTASRCAVPFFMSLLASRQEVTKKRAKTFPLGSPFPCRATWRNKRDHIFCFRAVLQMLPPRAAGIEKQNVLMQF